MINKLEELEEIGQKVLDMLAKYGYGGRSPGRIWFDFL